MEEGNKNKEVDLMEQVGNIKYDENAYFELCREHVLEAIKEVSFMTDDLALFDKLLKYFDLSFSKEIRDIILGKYDRDLLIEYSAEQKNKIVAAIQELKKQKYFNYDDYSNRLCGKMPFMHSKWLINENSFEITLCNVIKACHLFEFNGDKKQFIESIAEILKDFYKIYPDNNAEFGYRVIPKHNIEIIASTEKLTEKEPSLKEVLNDMDSLKYIEALQKLAKLLGKHRYEYKKLIQNTDNSLFDIEKFFNFVNNYDIRHGDEDTREGEIKKQKQPTDEQLKVYLDFGLSIYRLFSIYQDNNNEKLAKE